MKKTILSALLLCMVLLFAGCGSGAAKDQEMEENTAGLAQQETVNPEEEGQTEGAAEKTDQVASGTDQASTSTEDLDSAQTGKRAIVVYFSRVGNTDFPADMDATSSASMQIDDNTLKGNAQMVAEWIADEAGCETFEIVTEEAYPVDYEKTVNQARNEQKKDLRPVLKTKLSNLADYDTLYLVYPNWWSDMPMPVYSFLDEYDLSGKKINVFVTHEGSSFSSTIDKIKELEPDAEISEGLDVKGGSLTDWEEDVRLWVAEN